MSSKPNTNHQSQWIYPEIDEHWVAKVVNEFMIHPIIAQILAARGFSSFDEIHDYLYAQLPNLHSPHLLSGMERATKRIEKSLKTKERILVYGDNDVDGITGCVLLTEFFRSIGLEVYFYVSNRNHLNQSVLMDALEFAIKKECTLIITVDCGITAAKEIKAISEKKIDVIVTDHHEPTQKLPHTVATLNPKLINDNYPNKELTGVGVAFKLVHALTNKLIASNKLLHKNIDLKSYLDLVALGTIADMGSLLGENRIMVRYGLQQLNSTKRVGLRRLFSVCGLQGQTIGSNEIVLKIAPRINSLGRIANPLKGVELLLARDEQKAENLANELDLNNKARQELEQEMVSHLDYILDKEPFHLDHKAIVLSSDAWHAGIVPLLSTRVARKYNRPCAIIAIDNGFGKGSMRSIKAFPLLGPLKSMKEIFVNFGGHDFAAGITIEEGRIEDFRKRFIEIADGTLGEQDVAQKLHLDVPLQFSDIDFDLIESLKLLEPFGQDNLPPIFYTQAKQVWLPKLIKKNHLKLFLEQSDVILEGIGFNLAEARHSILKRNIPIKIAFTPQVFNYQNQSRMQLLIREFLPL